MHDRAAVSAKWMVENLCYYENVYFNEKQQMFRVETPNSKVTEPGFIRVNDMRKFWESADKFDEYLYEMISLDAETINSQEHTQIFQKFRKKFIMLAPLFNYERFYRKIMYRACKDMID